MATLDTTTDTCDIPLNLEEDPELNYFSWKVHAEDAASSAATLVEPTGLLTTILKDPAWDIYPPNRSVSPGGTLTIAARPAIPVHMPITAGMTNAQISGNHKVRPGTPSPNTIGSHTNGGTKQSLCR